MTTDNHVELLAMAAGKSQREIEQMVAAYSPRPDVADSIRKLPELPARRPAAMQPDEAATVEPVPVLDVSPPTAPSRPVDRGRSEPLSADRYRVQLTAGPTLMDKIEQARALLGHQVPGGELAAIFERALDALIADRNKKKFGATDKPREQVPPRSAPPKMSTGRRRIPSAVRRAVAARDGLRCTYVDEDGNRCERLDAWSSITSCPRRSEEARPWTTSDSGAEPTICIAPSSSSGAITSSAASLLAARRVDGRRLAGSVSRPGARRGVSGDAHQSSCLADRVNWVLRY